MRRISLILSFIGSLSFCFGQSGMELDWVQFSLGGSFNEAKGVAVDSDNHIYHCGSLSNDGQMDFNGPSIPDQPQSYSYIAKIGSKGNFIWGKSFDELTSNRPYFKEIKLTQSGDVICIGTFIGVIDFDPSENVFELNSVGGSGAFILKLSSDGAFIWAKALQVENKPNSWNEINGFDLDANDNVFLSGLYSGGVDFDPGPDSVNYSSGFTSEKYGFILKLDQNGKYQWVNVLANIDSGLSAMCVDNQGDVVTTGYFYNSLHINSIFLDIQLTTGMWSNYNQFVVKYDTHGQAKWVKQVASSGWQISDVLSNKNNDIFIVGNFYNGINFSPGTTSDFLQAEGFGSSPTDGFVAKYSNAGDFLWANQIRGKYNELSRTATFNKYENILIAAQIGQDSTFYNSTYLGDSTYNNLILELNPNGGLEGVFKFYGDIRFNDFAVDSENNLIGVGVCNNGSVYPLDFDPSVYSSYFIDKQGYGAVLTKYRLIPGASDDLLIYPNPTDGELVINLGAMKGPVVAQVFDYSGRLLKEIVLIEKLTVVDFSSLANGMHVLRISAGEKTNFQKFIKR